MTKNTKIIKGSGGPPPPPPAPYRAPDTLHSRSFASLQDLISEGEIEGFATASKAELTKGSTAYNNASLKDVFLDDTPILTETANNSSPAEEDFNFKNITFQSRFGTNPQTPMTGFPSETRSPTGVGVPVVNADGTTSGGISGSVTRRVSNTDVDAVVVTLNFPAIQVFEDDGDIRGDTVEYKIQIQYQSGGYADIAGTPFSVTGRTADAYARDHRITFDRGRIDAGTAVPVDIRVIRNTKTSTTAERVNAFEWLSIQEVINNNSTYNDSAYVALRLDSKIFNNIPSRKYRIRGIKVRIPGAGANNSGTPDVDPATGRIRYPDNYIFNGTMQQAVYSNCPAMCLLDLLTNKRYGLGDHIAPDQSTDAKLYSNIDLFSYVAASKYANELVDDGSGSGSQEARFSCNVNIQSPKEAFAAINDLAGVMRCMPIWSAGSITITQDKEVTPSYLFNLANVGEAGFNYQGSSLKTRHSVISVSYFNMDSKEIDFEVVEDATAIQKFGTSVKQVKAFACTSRNQAARLGRAILFAEQNESETVTFSTSIDAGVVVRPGSVIEINDPVRAGARRGGRVKASTTTTVTMDGGDENTLPSLNDSPTISVLLSDGTVEVGVVSDITDGVITVNSVSKVNDEGLTVTQSTFSSAPQVNSPYLISSNGLKTQLFRVIQVQEGDDVEYAITALSYVPGKYAFIENPNISLPTRTVSLLNAPAEAPEGLDAQEKIVVINSIARSKLIVDWKPVRGVTQYQVNYQFENGNFVSEIVFSSDFELIDTQKGRYTVQVFSFNASGKLSPKFTERTFETQGKIDPPENVSNLTLEPINEQFVRLSFDQAKAIDVLHGGRVYVRHSNRTGADATFQAAQDVVTAVAGNSTEVIAPALAGTYLLKFQDDGGRFSPQETKVALPLVNILDSITIREDTEHSDSPPFNNTTSSLFSNAVYDSTKGGIKISNITITSPATKATGTYTFPHIIDLEGTFSLVIKRQFQGAGYYPSNLFDSRTGKVDTWDDWDGDVANSANAKLAVRTTSASPSSSSYQASDFNSIDSNTFSNGTFRGRGFQFQTTLETSDPAQNMLIQQLGYSAEMLSRTEQSNVIASGSAAKVVTFTAPFFVGTSSITGIPKPSVNITPQHSSSKQMATGDYFELTNITGTGFTVHFKNSSGASIDRDFTYSATGFGKGG